jgi:murein DD-endopeptidase MepM/ murein hydrolase activator NlpD
MIRPCEGIITSGYHERRNTQSGIHGGIDIFNFNKETEIFAPYAGVVEITGYSKSFGNRVWIRMSDGWCYVLAHLKTKPTMFAGQKITEGHFVGLMGNTGMSRGEHLHFEERKNPFLGEPTREPELIKLYA